MGGQDQWLWLGYLQNQSTSGLSKFCHYQSWWYQCIFIHTTTWHHCRNIVHSEIFLQRSQWCLSGTQCTQCHTVGGSIQFPQYQSDHSNRFGHWICITDTTSEPGQRYYKLALCKQSHTRQQSLGRQQWAGPMASVGKTIGIHSQKWTWPRCSWAQQ